MASLCTQGLLKVRKRVTLMVVTVRAIFGIFWATDLILHALEDIGSFKFNSVVFPIGNTMLMFNFAVNPFAYALINQRFRENIKGMIRCSSSSSAPRVHAAREPQGIELYTNTYPTNTAGPNSTE